MINIFEMYDWQLMSQILLICSIAITVMFYKRISKYSDILVALPFSFSLGISLFLSENLITYFFFTEVLLGISSVIYKRSYKQTNGRYYENVRYFFWVIILYVFYNCFGTFEFNRVPNNTGIELTFVVALLLTLIFILLLNFVLRKKDHKSTIVESIGYEIFTVSIFCLKTILILSAMTDSIQPSHHTIIDILIITYIGIGCALAVKYYKTSNIFKLNSIFRALVLLSILPLLIIGENIFWDNFTEFCIYIITGFIFLEVFINYFKKGRFKSLIIFILLCFISGISPLGHIFILFKSLIDNDSQVTLFIGIFTSLITMALVSKKFYELSDSDI